MSVSITNVSQVQYVEGQNQSNSNFNSSSPRAASLNLSTDMFKQLVDGACNLTDANGGQQGEANGFLTYLNPYYGIVIQYPSDWTYKDSGPGSQDSKKISIVTFSPPLSSDPNAETSFQIWTENLGDPTITLDEYARKVIKSYRENNLNFKLLLGTSTNSTISNGNPAYDILFTDYSDNLQRKSIEKGAISNVSNRAYYITFNTDSSLYDKFNPIVKRMLSTFGIYDYRNLPDEERNKIYIQGYNDGLEFMIRALCMSPERNEINADDQ